MNLKNNRIECYNTWSKKGRKSSKVKSKHTFWYCRSRSLNWIRAHWSTWIQLQWSWQNDWDLSDPNHSDAGERAWGGGDSAGPCHLWSQWFNPPVHSLTLNSSDPNGNGGSRRCMGGSSQVKPTHLSPGSDSKEIGGNRWVKSTHLLSAPGSDPSGSGATCSPGGTEGESKTVSKRRSSKARALLVKERVVLVFSFLCWWGTWEPLLKSSFWCIRIGSQAICSSKAPFSPPVESVTWEPPVTDAPASKAAS